MEGDRPGIEVDGPGELLFFWWRKGRREREREFEQAAKKRSSNQAEEEEEEEETKKYAYLSSVCPFELHQNAALEPHVLLVATWSESESDHGCGSSRREARWLAKLDAGIGDGSRVDAQASIADGDEAAHGDGSTGMRGRSDVR